MSILSSAVFVLFLSHGVFTDETTTGKTVINVDLYYESLCGDSVNFVKKQLVPSYPHLKDHLKVNFIPYGKAMHSRDEETGRWLFTCQHGPTECKGNRAQACALEAIEKSEKAENRQQLSVNLVGCVMSSTHPATSVPECAENVGLSAATRKYITDCDESALSENLLAAYGDKTLSLNPSLTFVPTIVLNGDFSQENQTAARFNFQKLICDKIPQTEKPTVCASV